MKYILPFISLVALLVAIGAAGQGEWLAAIISFGVTIAVYQFDKSQSVPKE